MTEFFADEEQAEETAIFKRKIVSVHQENQRKTKDINEVIADIGADLSPEAMAVIETLRQDELIKDPDFDYKHVMFEPTGIGKDIFLQRYAAPGETTWNKRSNVIANLVSSAEKEESKVYYKKRFTHAINAADLIPGGRIVFGAGRARYNLLNCYVIIPEDSVESIGKTIQDMYKISCSGGGVGFNFSKIRPKGDDIQNIKSSAPGPISVMRMINEIGNHVKSGKNRRVAIMGILDVSHPDVLEFLHVKLDLEELNNFNISVAITDEFLDACDRNQEWTFSYGNKTYYLFQVEKKVFEVDEHGTKTGKFNIKHINVTAYDEEDALERAKQHYLDRYDDEFIGVKKVTLQAKTLFAKIWENAVESGDPGIFNISLSNKYTNVSYFEKLLSTNPCLIEGSLVHTAKGLIPVEQIREGDLITTVEGIGRPVKTIETHQNLDTYKVVFSDGSEQIATAQHQFYVLDGKITKPKKLMDMKVGDKVKIAMAQMPCNAVPNKPHTISDREYGLMLGTIYGDGCYTEDQLERNSFKISTSIDDDEWNKKIIELFGKPSSEYRGVDSKKRENKSLTYCFSLSTDSGQLVKESLVTPAKAIDKSIPLELINTNEEFLAGLIDGLISTDGNVNLKSSSPMIRFTSGSKALATDVKRILSMFGIHAGMYKTIRKEHMYDGRRIRSNTPKYDVIIGASDFLTFYNRIGCSNPKKWEKIRDVALFGGYSLTHQVTTVKSIDYHGKGNVYDLYEPVTDTWISEGIVSRGCGEITLPSYGNCCLGHVNLANMVSDNGVFNWRQFKNAIKLGIRFLDNVLDVNTFPTPETREIAHRSRRIGLGCMGYHYMLLKLGIRYGSEKCLEFTERLATTFRNEAYLASCALAKEKGAFPEFDAEKYLNEGFAKTLPPRIRFLIKKNGIRNAVMLTLAPTGCQVGNTLVSSNKGILRLDEIVDVNGEQWQDHNLIVAQDTIGDKPSTKGFMNGLAKTKRIKLYSGQYLESTCNHMYRVITSNGDYEWKRADQLVVDDCLAVKLNTYTNMEEPKLVLPNINGRQKTIKFPSNMTPDLAKLLGLLYADGSVHYRSLRIHCNSNDNVQIDTCVKLVEDIFGFTPKLNKAKNANCVSVNINSVEVKEFLRINNLLKSKSHLVNIPKLIRQSSVASLQSFIDGYIMADGCSVPSGYQIDTVSFEMAQQLLTCIRALGGNAIISEYDNVKGSKGTRTKYRIRLVKLGVDDECLRYLNKEKSMYQKYINDIGNNMTFDKITFIEDSENLTYDIEVPETNTYIANGIVSHNTTSMVAGVSSGIEPIFAPIYKRRYRVANTWKEEVVLDPMFKKWVEEGKPIEHFVGAYDVTPEEHMQVQACWQRYIDSAISKTINLPEEAKAEDFIDTALEMVRYLKGLTVYRAGSKGNEPLEAIPTTAENIKKYINSGKEEVSGGSCKLGGECG